MTSKDLAWLIRGRQIRAVALAIRKPMTNSEILATARQYAPLIKSRDVSVVLAKMKERNLAFCVNRHRQLGRLYYLTPKGCRVMREFGVRREPLQEGAIWKAYSFVVGGPVRSLVLKEIGRSQLGGIRKTRAVMQKNLSAQRPIDTSRMCRTLRELRAIGLVRLVVLDRGRVRVYELSRLGKKVLEILLQ